MPTPTPSREQVLLQTAVVTHAEVLVAPTDAAKLRARGKAFWTAVEEGITEEKLAARVDLVVARVHDIVTAHEASRGIERMHEEQKLYGMKLAHYLSEGAQFMLTEADGTMKVATVESVNAGQIKLDNGIVIELRAPFELPLEAKVVRIGGDTYSRADIRDAHFVGNTRLAFNARELMDLARHFGIVPVVVEVFSEKEWK